MFHPAPYKGEEFPRTFVRNMSNQSTRTAPDRHPHGYARGYLPREQGEREGEAPSGFAGGGGDASPYNGDPAGRRKLDSEASAIRFRFVSTLSRYPSRSSLLIAAGTEKGPSDQILTLEKG